MTPPPPLPTTAFAAAAGPPASPGRRPVWALLLLLAALALAGALAALLAMPGMLLPAARTAEAHPISINSISITSDAGDDGDDGEYTAGDVITFEVTFSENIKSWSNNPYIGIQVGNNARNANAEAVPDGGNTDATIAFHYTVGAVDQTPTASPCRSTPGCGATLPIPTATAPTTPSPATPCPSAWLPAGPTRQCISQAI